MQLSAKSIAWKVLLPVLISLVVVIWLFHEDFSFGVLTEFDYGWRAIAGISLALFFVAGRDFGLTWRFHTIASPALSWGQALRVDLMCAFTSAITPSAVGGSALAIFYLNREGVRVGRATTLTLTTLFLDELFFVVFCPLILLLTPISELFGAEGRDAAFIHGIEVVFWLVYAGIVIWTAILFTGILLRPQWVKKTIDKIFSMRWLRRWQKQMSDVGDNIVATSNWVKGCSMRWWLNVFGATVVSWFSRYLIVNALFWGLVPGASGWLIFSRQFVVWVILMVSPTPGGSGVSEWLFTEYYGDLIGAAGVALIIAVIWRLITYYIYLALGLILVPSYFTSKKSETEESNGQSEISQIQE